jgi:hypothetical protein
MLPNFHPPPAVDDHDRKLLTDIEQVGWHVLQITPDETGPGYSFTVGLYYSFGHPEIIVMGLAPTLAHQVINLAVINILSGENFPVGAKTDLLLKDLHCTFVPVALKKYEEYLGYGIWFYKSLDYPFPALQLIWPDKRDVLPWEPGYDRRYDALQPLLNRQERVDP